MNATAWQLPPDSDVSCGATAATESLNLRTTVSGTDECQTFLCLASPRDIDAVQAKTGGSNCGARSRAATWSCCSPTAPSLLRTASEGDIKPQGPNRPFLSLMLPEWVHEKAAQDEALGLFRCRSPISLCDTSPSNSSVTSPVSSRSSSPLVFSNPKANSHTSRVRRSSVCWADLVDSDEETEVFSGSFISSLTSTVPTDSSVGSLSSSLVSSPRVLSPIDTCVSWADLAENEEIIDEYGGTFVFAAPQPKPSMFLSLQSHLPPSHGDWLRSEGERLPAT